MNAGETTMPDVPEEAGLTIDIACANVTKVFRDFWMRPRVRAVEGVNLQVYRGEIFGLLGPNGSGKSTTIKMLLGLLQPTSGRIAVLGKRPRDVGVKKFIGYLPEESYLYRFLSGRETLEYYARLFRIERQARRERIDMLLEMVGLEAVQDRAVGEYSKGMQRRIGLAQSLINDPQLLILDEPTSGMDPVGANQIKELIATLARRGKTVLLCSHLLSDVEDLCDRVAIMYGGRVEAAGTCEELLEEQDGALIKTASLPSEVLSEMKRLLASHAVTIESVKRPRRRLENLFLDIVQRARAAGIETSGAGNNGEVAPFLTDSVAPPATEMGLSEKPNSSTIDEPAVDTALLDELVKR
jgi:ABC-2 type transport system ATP-binding protein